MTQTSVVEKAGDGGFMEYRIPSVAATKKGTVLVAYESRREAGNDWTECRVTVRRSTNGGKSFGQAYFPQELLARCEGGITFSNPVLTVDGGLIHLIFCQDYERVWYCFSADDGMSFCEPVEITGVFRNFPWEWNVCASGPGHGIVTSAGRLIVPVWLAMGKVRTDREAGGRVRDHFPSVAGCIWSDDHGRNWNTGFLTQGIENANETTAAELSDGRILFNFRNERYEKCRVLGVAGPELERLEKVWSEERLPDPTCFGSMISSEGVLYFVNCANHDPWNFYAPRIHLTLWESSDNAAGWVKALTVDENGGYADLAAHKNAVYVFYERGINGKVQELILKKISL